MPKMSPEEIDEQMKRHGWSYGDKSPQLIRRPPPLVKAVKKPITVSTPVLAPAPAPAPAPALLPTPAPAPVLGPIIVRDPYYPTVSEGVYDQTMVQNQIDQLSSKRFKRN